MLSRQQFHPNGQNRGILARIVLGSFFLLFSAPSRKVHSMKQLLGRIGTAWRILMGREPTWWGIQAEWAEIQMGAADLFQKHNALAARLAKQVKALEKAKEDCGCQDEEPVPTTLKARKQALRRRAFGSIPVPSHQPPPNGSDAPEEIPPEGRWVPATEDS